MNEQERKAIEQLQSGYNPAWATLFTEFATPLYRRLMELTEGDADKAQDYTQEIFFLLLKAIRKIPLPPENQGDQNP